RVRVRAAKAVRRGRPYRSRKVLRGASPVARAEALRRGRIGPRVAEKDVVVIAATHRATIHTREALSRLRGAVASNAVQVARQDMEEKAADELGGVERHGLEPIAAFDPIVFPFEGDAVVVERDETRVGDGEAMSVAGKIGKDGLRPGERPFGEDNLAAGKAQE